MSAKSFVFTLNNWTEEERDNIKLLTYEYLVFGYETGKEGTPHLQGYIEFTLSKRFTTLKKFNERIHWEARKGTQQQAITYCKKDKNFEEYGIPKQQGERKDLDITRNLALTEGMRAVSAQCNLQQIKTAEKFLTYNEEPRDWKPLVYWIHGKSGTGKSKTARDLMKDDIYTKNDGTKWWDGYDSHENVILDDFRASWWSLTEMLSLLDRYEKRVEYKGGYRQFKPKFIIITSIFKPDQCYNCEGEPIEQLTRRIDRVIELI